MRINGENFKLQAPCILLHFLEQKGCALDRVAVELNGKIIPKNLYESTHVNDSDSIEIVSFIGGG